MKQIIGLICLSLVCLGIASVEYQMILHFRSAVILIALAVLGALSVVLFRAPEGYERSDGFHVCPRAPRCRRVGGVRPAQRARVAR